LLTGFGSQPAADKAPGGKRRKVDTLGKMFSFNQPTIQPVQHVDNAGNAPSQIQKPLPGMFGTNTPIPRNQSKQPASLAEIREAAAQLNSHIVSAPGSLPSLDRDLQQIENQTRNLYAKMNIGQDALDPRAQYLLANKGFDAARLCSTMTLLGKTTSSEQVAETDLDRFLEDHHNQIILKSIQEQKRRTAQDYEEIMTLSINSDWEKAKRRIYEELGQHRKPPGGLIQDSHAHGVEPREDFGVQSFAGTFERVVY